MACLTLKKDPDNKWFAYIDWEDWFETITDEFGGTVSITNSVWFLDAGLTEESNEIKTYVTVLYGSGGVDGTTYNITNRITYNPSALTPTDLTEDRTFKVKIQEK